MKAILEFDLPDDEFDYKCAINGYKWQLIVREIKNRLHHIYKHEISIINNKEAKKLEIIFAKRLDEVIDNLINEEQIFLEL